MRKFLVAVSLSNEVERTVSEHVEAYGATAGQQFMAQLIEMMLGGQVDVDTVTVVGPCCECGQVHEGYEPDAVSPCGHHHLEQCPNT